MFKKVLGLSVFTSAISFAVSANAQQDLNDYVTIMLDTTGSMNVVRPVDGLTRCTKAKNMLTENLGKAMLLAKNLKVVSFDTDVHDVSGGFINTEGLNQYSGDGKIIYDDLVQKVNALSCSGGTAIGDSVCEVFDELFQVNAGGSTQPVFGIYTDAGEWASDPAVCGGPVPDYVTTKIIPKSFENSPFIRVSATVLVNLRSGNPGLSADVNTVIENNLEDQSIGSLVQGFSTVNAEVNAFKILSQITGGNFHEVADTDLCETGCGVLDPVVDDPWTGGGFGR